MVGLQAASIEELTVKGGLPFKVAQQLYRALHPEDVG